MAQVLCNGSVIADNVRIADTYFTRLRGLLGKKKLERGEGLLLTQCSSVHCFFMKFTIDVVYLSKDMVVLGTETIRPWRIGKWVRGTVNTLELAEGAAVPKLQKGDRLVIQ